MLPYTEHFRLLDKAEGKTTLIPHEVVEGVVGKEFNLLKAWRKHLGKRKKGRL